jgi:hypothetical protein
LFSLLKVKKEDLHLIRNKIKDKRSQFLLLEESKIKTTLKKERKRSTINDWISTSSWRRTKSMAKNLLKSSLEILI